MTEHPTIAPAVLNKLRAICLDFPEAVEERAWTGTRWCVGKKNFAHVLVLAGGWPPAYARAAGTDGPACVLTFRLPSPKLQAPRYAQTPFFRPPWFADIVGLVLDGDCDWDEVEGLVADSYCLLAPKKLAALVDRAGR